MEEASDLPAIHVLKFSTTEPDILEDGALEFVMAQFHERMESASIREKMERVTLALDTNQVREPRVE